MGKNAVTQVALTGDYHIDSILTGYKWLPDGNGDYFIRVDTPGSWKEYGLSIEAPFGLGFRPLENPANAGRALAQWSHVAALNFVVGDSGDIRFAQTDADIRDTWLIGLIVEFNKVAYTQALGPEYDTRGDIWFVNSWAQSVTQSNNGKTNINADPGSYGFCTIMHEIGHALGLDHPHDGIQTTSDDYIGNTIMSYRSFPGGPLGYSNDYFPTTPSMYDIAALQHLYGPNLNYNAGPTAYRWETGAHIFETIWDAGGIDEIDWSNQSTSALIDIRNGAWSELGPAFIYSSTNSEANAVRNNTVAISLAATDNVTGDIIKDERGNAINTIENARGGSANDVIIGNQAANKIFGNGGNDTLQGREGSDTYVFHAGDGDDLINENGRGGAEIIELWGEGAITSIGQLAFSVPSATDSLAIDLGSAGGADLGSVTIAGMGTEASRVETLQLFGADSQLIASLDLVAKYNELAGGTPPPTGTWAFYPRSQTVSEEAGSVNLTLHRSDSSVAETVYVSTDDTSPPFTPNNNDYEDWVNRPVLFDVGDGDETISIYINDDTVAGESGEVFLVTARRSTSTATPTWLAEATVFIDDDDVAPPPGTGTTGNDTIIGTDGNDTIVGLGGDDDLRGLAGDDTYRFDLGWGHDRIFDVSGNDEIAFGQGISPSDIRFMQLCPTPDNAYYSLWLVSQDGSSIRIDHVFDENIIERVRFGDDYVTGIYGRTFVGTEEDDPYLCSLNTGDTISGLGGNDTIRAFAGPDWLLGGAGDDSLDGGTGEDNLYGGDGNDYLVGAPVLDTAPDTIDGGAGNDTCVGGGDGRVTITGGVGDDLLIGTGNDDTFVFSPGWGTDTIVQSLPDAVDTDTLVFQGISSTEVTWKQSGSDLIATRGTDSIKIWGQYTSWPVERAVFTDRTIDLTGSLPSTTPTAAADTLTGTSGDDTFDGLAGDDSIDGGAGNDTLTGGTGADLLYGNIGDDVFNLANDGSWGSLAAINRHMVSSAGVPDQRTISGRVASQDAMDGGDGTDSVYGTAGNDVLFYTDVNQPAHAAANASARLASIEYFDLGGGDDVLDMTNASGGYPTSFTALGGDGADALWGGLGNDTLDGGAGDKDFLTGGLGSDRLTGGAGKDIFGFSRDFGADVVTDFENGQDNIRLKGFGAAYDTYTEVRAAIVQQGADAVLTLAPAGQSTVTVTFLNTDVAVFDASDFTIIA